MAVNSSQRIRVQGGATGGTFILHFEGQSTPPLPYNATEEQVAAGLYVLQTQARRARNRRRRRVLNNVAAVAVIVALAVLVLRKYIR